MSLKFNQPLILGNRYEYNSDAFTVVGTPTVTADGIASGFSSTSGIDTIKLLPNTDSWEVKLRYIYKTSTNNYDYLIYNSAGDTAFNVTITNTGAGLTVFSESGGSNVAVNAYSSTLSFVNNDVLDFTFRYDSTEQKYYIEIYKNGDLFVSNSSAQTEEIIKQTNAGNIRLGFRMGTSRYARGSIDLKKFQVFVNGELKASGSTLLPKQWVNKPFNFDTDTLIN